MNILNKPSCHLSFPAPALRSPLAYTAASELCDALLSCSSMLTPRVPLPRPYDFPPLLKSCASLGLLPTTLSLHQQTVVLGYSNDAHISSSLLHAYARNGCLESARHVFDGMPVRNVVPWSAIIACYSRAGDVNTAFFMFSQMRSLDISPNSVTALGLLYGISSFDQLQCLHAHVIRCGFNSDIILANCLINAYCKCQRVELAQKLFDSMPFRDVVSWNSMLSGYSRTGCGRGCFDLFARMRLQRIHPDSQTYGALIFAVTSSGGGFIQTGKLFHGLVVTSGFGLDSHIETALVGMYLKFRSWDLAFILFDRRSNMDIVSWTAMISGLVQNDGADKALVIFHRMLKSGMLPAPTTIASVLAGCAQLGSLDVGASIHGFVMRRELPVDIAVYNSLITMYAKCGLVKQCQFVFDMMPDQDLVSWNALVSSYARNGHLDEAFFQFNGMRLARHSPDSITIVSLLQACASLGALHHGKLVHNYLVRQQIEACISIDTSLVDMYSKCGHLENAQLCFNFMQEQDVVAWSVIISAFGSHGMGEEALEMYLDFLATDMRPNDVMFLSVLSACSHAGLITEGLKIFKSMGDVFGIASRIEHLACVIDLLSRAGRVEEALGFVNKICPRPNADVSGILLNACSLNGYANLAEVVARYIAALRPQNAGSYVQLVHSYAAASRWDGVGEAWAHMKNLGLKKVPGWSFIDLDGSITTFFADHTSHPKHGEMIGMLKVLNNEMREDRQTTSSISN